MSEKRYFWLKLKEDFFDDKQIKYLRSLPDGDKIVITYLKMQLKSLKTNGTIRYDKLLPSSAEELSMMLDEDLNIVKFTLKALEQINAIEILEDESIFMLAMQELIGSEGSSALRTRAYRERKKLLLSQCNNNVQNVTSLQHGEIELEKDLDKEKELEVEVDKKKSAIFKICTARGIELSMNAKKFISDCLDNCELTPEVILYAISEALDHHAKSWSYIQTILNRYKFEGYKTIGQVKQDSAERIQANLPRYSKNELDKYYANI